MGGTAAAQSGGLRFQRQIVIGPFIVDFCCKQAKLIIEVDGGHHHEQKVYDDERTAFLEENGFCARRVSGTVR